MQKQRLKIWVPPAQCGKKSFGTVWDNTVSILRQGLLLHCSARCAEALLALPNDNECQNKNVLAHDFVYRSFASRRTKPIHWRYVLQRTAGFEPANIELDRLKEQEFFWHTLWNILVHRCEGLTQTPAWSNLASIFYHSVHCFSRKKSCENTRRVQFFNKLNEHLRRAEIFLAVWTTAFRKRKRNIPKASKKPRK